MCGPQSTATASALLIVSGGLDCKPDVICPHWPLLNNCLGHICYVCMCGRCNVLSSLLPPSITLVVLLYSDISNFTFWSVNILECKIFLIGFLDELGNFKQKKVLPFEMQFFSHFTATDPLREKLPSYIVFCMYYILASASVFEEKWAQQKTNLEAKHDIKRSLFLISYSPGRTSTAHKMRLWWPICNMESCSLSHSPCSYVYLVVCMYVCISLLQNSFGRYDREKVAIFQTFEWTFDWF